MAGLKMLTGIFSGSVGLIADGADTTVDTAASGIVWAGIKFKKELIGTFTIIGLMLATAVLLFYESVNSMIDSLLGTFTPMSAPYVVIAVELIAMVSMFMISSYQRYIGKRSQSLALISQSIDSKNSIYTSAAVIIGAIFTLIGVYWVDAIVGALIAARITIDGFNLRKEAVKSMRGEKPELSRYRVPFERHIKQWRSENFRNWILYMMSQSKDKKCTKAEIVRSLEKTFRPSYLPTVFAEFTAGRDVNFEEYFPELIAPLIEAAYVIETNGVYCLTSKGKTYIKDTVGRMRYKETEL